MSFDGYAKPAVIGAGIGFLMLLTFGQLSTELVNLPFFAIDGSRIRPLPQPVINLLNEATLLQICKSFLESGFWYLTIPVALACLIKSINDRQSRSLAHRLLATIINSSMVCGTGLYVVGFCTAVCVISTACEADLVQIFTFASLYSFLFAVLLTLVFALLVVMAIGVLAACERIFAVNVDWGVEAPSLPGQRDDGGAGPIRHNAAHALRQP